MLIDPVLAALGKELLGGKLYGFVELPLRSGRRDKLDGTGHSVPLDARTYEDEAVGRVASQCGDDITYLAGREHEKKEFTKLLSQDVILKNLVLTGLRGLGKTVLLEQFKPMAIQAGWLWAGTDLSESTSISEENLAIPKLVEARTFSERMFHVVFLNPLSEEETVKAIQEPVKKVGCPIHFAPESCKTVWNETRGYPYFIQYVCREVFDIWVQAKNTGKDLPTIPVADITRKLDTDFFAGRWAKATDRQRELLWVAATLPNCDSEFTVQELVENEANKKGLAKSFSGSHANQMLVSLCEAGLVYKNRHGKYSFAVPLLSEFIKRQISILASTIELPS